MSSSEQPNKSQKGHQLEVERPQLLDLVLRIFVGLGLVGIEGSDEIGLDGGRGENDLGHADLLLEETVELVVEGGVQGRRGHLENGEDGRAEAGC